MQGHIIIIYKQIRCSNQQKQVIAEFVENEKIQSIIEEMGIRYSQGYYFSKPQPWETAAIE